MYVSLTQQYGYWSGLHVVRAYMPVAFH